MKRILILLMIIYLSCQSAHQRAALNPFYNVCPNFGFINESEIPLVAIYENERNEKYVYTRFKSKAMDGGQRYQDEEIAIKELTNAQQISTLKELNIFEKRYKEICEGTSPFLNKTKYKINEKESILFKTIPEEKILDIREDGSGFKDAWYNRYISPSENTALKVSEFDYDTKKLEMERIRNFKNLITKVGDGTDLALSDYNFKQECFNFRYMNSGVPYINVVKYMKDPNGSNGIGTVELAAYHQYEKNHCIPIPKAVAEQFKKDNETKKYNWELLLEIKKVIDAPMDLKCKDYTYDYTKIACKKDNWEKVKIRRFELAIVAFKAIHIDSEEILEGKIK